MRFLFGLAIGFGIGFAGAILFAPENSREGERWFPGGAAGDAVPPSGNGTTTGLQRAMKTLRERVAAAKEEAKQASAEAEREMRGRYEKMTGRRPRDS